MPKTGEIFDFKTRDYFSRTNIIEYDLGGIDTNVLMDTAPTATLKTGTSKAEQNGANNMMQVDYKISEQVSSMRAIMGQKTSDGNDSAGASIGNLQKMSIWVPGWNGNRMLMTVKVELPRPITTEQSENSEVASGEWVVEGVRDKIISGYFIQELFLTKGE